MAWPNLWLLLVVLVTLQLLAKQSLAEANAIGISESRRAETFVALKAQENEESRVPPLQTHALNAMKIDTEQSAMLQSELGIHSDPQEECQECKFGIDVRYMPKNQRTAVALVRGKQWRRLLRDSGGGRGKMKSSRKKVKKEFDAEKQWKNGEHEVEANEVMKLQKSSDTPKDEWQNNHHQKTEERKQEDSTEGQMQRNDEATTEKPTEEVATQETNNYEEWKQKVQKATNFHIAKAKTDGSDAKSDSGNGNGNWKSDANEWGKKEEISTKEWNARNESDSVNENWKTDEMKWEAKEVKPEGSDAKSESGNDSENWKNHEGRFEVKEETKTEGSNAKSDSNDTERKMNEAKLEAKEVKAETERSDVKSVSDNNNESWRTNHNNLGEKGEAKTEESEHAGEEWVAKSKREVKLQQDGTAQHADESENLKADKHKVEEADDRMKLQQGQAEVHAAKEDNWPDKEYKAEQKKDLNLEMNDNQAIGKEWKVQEHKEEKANDANPWQDEKVEEWKQEEHKKDNTNDAKPWQDEKVEEWKQEEHEKDKANDAKPWEDEKVQEGKQEVHEKDKANDAKPWHDEKVQEWKQEEHEKDKANDVKPWQDERVEELKEEDKKEKSNDAKPFQDEASKQKWNQEEQKENTFSIANPWQDQTTKDAWKQEEHKEKNSNDAKPFQDETMKEEWKQEEHKEEKVNDAKPWQDETTKEAWKQEENSNDAKPSQDETTKEEWKQEENKEDKVNDAKPSQDETTKEEWKQEEHKDENSNDAKPSKDGTAEEWKQEENKEDKVNDAKPSQDETTKEEWKQEEHKEDKVNDAKPSQDATTKEEWKQEEHKDENSTDAKPSKDETAEEWKQEEHKEDKVNDTKPSQDGTTNEEWKQEEHSDENSNDAKPSKDETAKEEWKQEEHKEDKVDDAKPFLDETAKEEWKQEEHKEDKVNDANPLQDETTKEEWTGEDHEVENKTVGWETNSQPKVSTQESEGNNVPSKDTGVGNWEVQKKTEKNGSKQRSWENAKESTKHDLDPEAKEPNLFGEDSLQGKSELQMEHDSSTARTENHVKHLPVTKGNDDIIETAKADESWNSAQNRDNDENLVNEKDLLVNLADNQTQVTISNVEEPDSTIGVSAEPSDVEDYRDFIHEFSSLPSKFQETAGHVAQLLPEFHKLSEQSKNYFVLANQQIAESFLPFVGKQYAPLVASLISYGLLLLPLAFVIYFFEHIRAIFTLQKMLLCANLYLAGYFATLTMASFILTTEPMSFFQKYSPSSFISLMLLQVMGYLLYLLLEIIDLFKNCSRGVPFAKLMACIHCLVATLVGLHYYDTVFHRAMARKAPQTSWRTYGIYSIAFFILCLITRTQQGKKQYFRRGDDITDKKN